MFILNADEKDKEQHGYGSGVMWCTQRGLVKAYGTRGIDGVMVGDA